MRPQNRTALKPSNTNLYESACSAPRSVQAELVCEAAVRHPAPSFLELRAFCTGYRYRFIKEVFRAFDRVCRDFKRFQKLQSFEKLLRITAVQVSRQLSTNCLSAEVCTCPIECDPVSKGNPLVRCILKFTLPSRDFRELLA